MQPTLKTRKPADNLLESDLTTFPIWEFADDEERDETWLRPVDAAAVPAGALSVLVAARFTAASGREFPGFVSVSTDEGVEIGGGAILHGSGLASVPAPDFWHAESDARALCALLGLPPSDLFPLRYRMAVPLEGEADPRSGKYALLDQDFIAHQ